MSWTVNSAFKAGTDGCGGCGGCSGWIPSEFCGDYGCRSDLFGLSGVFPNIFVLGLNDLSSETLSSTSSILSLQ